MTEQQMLLAAVGALSTVVATLFGLLVKRIAVDDKRNKSTEQRLEECEEDREKLWKHVRKLEVMLARLTRVSCSDGACPVRRVTDVSELDSDAD